MCEYLFKKLISAGFIIGVIVSVSLLTSAAYASDMSDAASLRKECETEFDALKIPVNNFGNSFVKRRYEEGSEVLRKGKIYIAQSKYQNAIETYKKYLEINKSIYKELANDYISRAEMIYLDTAKELVDYIDNEKVSQYFGLANQNVVDAKKAAASGNFKLAIETCRNSKKYSILSYKAAGKAVPDKYRKDITDNNKELHKE